MKTYCFVVKGIYIGKAETTKEAIEKQFCCSIEGNTVYILAVRKRA